MVLEQTFYVESLRANRSNPFRFSQTSINRQRSTDCFVVPPGLLAMTCISTILLFLSYIVSPAIAQTDASNAESRLDHYMKFAHPIGTANMDFPGSKKVEQKDVGGYTFIHLPTQEVMEAGDTIITDHAYLLDLSLSHAGLYLAADTLKSVSDYTPFQFIFDKNKIIHTELAASHTREQMRGLDSSFNGCLGWGLINQFVTTYDFKRNVMTFYPLYANVAIADDDSNALQLPILDDAKVTYCSCAYHTIWMDVQAPPLPPGHVNIAFHEPQSQVFITALDSATRVRIDKQILKDSLDGIRRPLGLNLGKFVVGRDAGHPVNLATRGTKRVIDPLPAIYHDLNVPVLGTLGTDVLRTFSAIIIDPSRNKLIFIR